MAQTPNVRPAFLGTIHSTCYDGVTDDLLTAGLGNNSHFTANLSDADRVAYDAAYSGGGGGRRCHHLQPRHLVRAGLSGRESGRVKQTPPSS
jgi:3HB-oligomer hydrolase 3HBOH